VSGERPPAIEVSGLRKVYPAGWHLGDTLRLLCGRPPRAANGRTALDGLALRLERGGALGVLGRNGSGKTTLLRILAGSLAPSAGAVRVRGRVAALIDLGAGLDPALSGRENALLLGVFSGVSQRGMQACLEGVKEFSGLGAAFEQPVRGYSDGMRLRLAFGAAVHSAPDVLLIDEVLAVGDAFFQQRCLRRIRELQGQGATVVLVTHDPSAVFSFCDRALWLEHGRIACEGEPAKVVREYMGARYRDDVALEEAPLPADAESGDDGEDLEPAPSVPHVDHRYGDGRARIEGVALRDADGRPLGMPIAGERLRVVITARCEAPLAEPIVGFTLRGRLGEVLSATNTAYEGRRLPSLRAGDRISVEFALRWPPFASGAFSISPAIADGTLDRHHMSDWVDNALVTEASNPAVRYGWIRMEGVAVRWSLHQDDRP
jgi:ABC-type polysaccharide/polyol phosphate transport system ATPase subunit